MRGRARSSEAETRARARLEAHLTDPFTSRDLFGVVRGRCASSSCAGCPGGYLKSTADYTKTPGGNGEAGGPALHPHNDPSLMNCSRCGCPAAAHDVAHADDARARGNDAFAVGDLPAALAAYSKALALAPGDARNYSNRAAALLAD